MLLTRVGGLYAPSSVTPVSLDQTVNFPNGAVSANIDVTMTVSSGATLLIAIVPNRGTLADITGAVWDPAGANQAMTLLTNGSIATGAVVQGLKVFGLINPTAGASKTLRATTGGTFATSIAGASFFNTNTSALSSAVINPASAKNGSTTTSYNASITAAANNMGLAVTHCANTNSSSATWTAATQSSINMRSGFYITTGTVSSTIQPDVADECSRFVAEISV